MNNFYDILRLLQREGFWGPFLVMVGMFLLYSAASHTTHEPTLADYAVITGAGFVTLSGVALMFKQFSAAYTAGSVKPPEEGQEDAAYVVQQLHRNFEVLRAQTNQGFLLSGVFMAIGLLIIIASLFAPTLGLRTQGVDNLGVLAGVVTEFISGTALFLYRLNFSRLNQTSDRLDDAWRVLAAFKLTRELPDDKKSEATMQLISSLTKGHG